MGGGHHRCHHVVAAAAIDAAATAAAVLLQLSSLPLFCIHWPSPFTDLLVRVPHWFATSSR